MLLPTGHLNDRVGFDGGTRSEIRHLNLVYLLLNTERSLAVVTPSPQEGPVRQDHTVLKLVQSAIEPLGHEIGRLVVILIHLELRVPSRCQGRPIISRRSGQRERVLAVVETHVECVLGSCLLLGVS